MKQCIFTCIFSDIDECNENGHICLNGQCINKPGSYHCVCNKGYQLSPDGAFCVGKSFMLNLQEHAYKSHDNQWADLVMTWLP